MSDDPTTRTPSQTDSDELGDRRDGTLAAPNADPDRAIFAPDGTDLTLIRELLNRSPEERIRTLEAIVESIQRLRDARTT